MGAPPLLGVGAAGFAQGSGAGKQNKMGPKEEKSDWERSIIPGYHNLILSSPPCQPKGGGGCLVSGLNCWVMGRGEVCVCLEGGERRRVRGEEREIQGSGHLPRKITNILQKRNPKTEVIVWKKSVSQTLEPE